MLNYKIIIFIIFLAICGNCLAQSKMLCDQEYIGSIYYSNATQIITITQLPIKIQRNLCGYLNQSLGLIKDSTAFCSGQIVNLRKEFKRNTIVYRHEWIVAKYDLNFLIRDTSIGIDKYYINIRMDEFGQIIYSNWPRHGYSDKVSLSKFRRIENSALILATKKNYNINGYKVKLEYNEKLDMLCWTFYFVRESDDRFNSYNVISIDWNTHEPIKNDGIVIYK